MTAHAIMISSDTRAAAETSIPYLARAGHAPETDENIARVGTWLTSRLFRRREKASIKSSKPDA